MKFIFSILGFFLFANVVCAQKIADKPELKIHTKFTLELITKDSTQFDYRILKSEPYKSDNDSDSARKALDDSLKFNQVQGVFTNGNFGSRKATLLVIKTGNENPLDYNLYIQRNGKRKFKKTSTINISQSPTIEVWQEELSSLKILDFKKVKVSPILPEIKIDTTCYSTYDILDGNKLFEKQLPFVLDIVTDNRKKIEIDKVKRYEDSINSIEKSNWGYLNNLLIKKDERYMDGYLNSRKIAQPLVFEITECPFLKRNTAYYFTKRKKDIRLVMFQWKLRWVDGWQSKDHLSISENYNEKFEFLKTKLSEFMSIDKKEHPNHSSDSYEIVWFKKNDILAKLSFYINDRYKNYSLSLHIYKEE
ncbi:hypothetical protein [Wocania ichthyoenteri]|uniref:hypothetical protein n=1 Tax=Wocania ichthyoenteri TaxID=1230531 RepID=UPI00053D02EA|nr:hypothetical protein [Wocania ichthyoenteri]